MQTGFSNHISSAITDNRCACLLIIFQPSSTYLLDFNSIHIDDHKEYNPTAEKSTSTHFNIHFYTLYCTNIILNSSDRLQQFHL